MKNLINKYLDIINDEKENKGLKNYAPIIPMLRVEGDKLYIGSILTTEDDDVWSEEGSVKGDYWVLVDPVTDKVVAFNKTSEKDYVIGNVIPKVRDDKQKEMAKYTIKKTMQYKNYLMNDIKNEELPIQKELSDLLGNTIEIDNEEVNTNEYLLSIFEEDIKEAVDKLVKTLTESKYSSIMFYYEKLLESIIDNYKKNNQIDKESMKRCAKIINYYYDGVTYIDNFFNI